MFSDRIPHEQGLGRASRSGSLESRCRLDSVGQVVLGAKIRTINITFARKQPIYKSPSYVKKWVRYDRVYW